MAGVVSGHAQSTRSLEPTRNPKSYQHHLSLFILTTRSPRLSSKLYKTVLLLVHSFTMAQIRGTANYHLGNQGAFGGPNRNEATTDPSPLDAIREQTSKIEDMLDTLAEPLKPYVVSLFTSCVAPLPYRVTMAQRPAPCQSSC